MLGQGPSAWGHSHVRNVITHGGFPFSLQLLASCSPRPFRPGHLARLSSRRGSVSCAGRPHFLSGPSASTPHTLFKNRNSFIEMEFVNYEVHSFQVCSAMVFFSMFTELFGHHLTLILGHFLTPNQKPAPISSHPPTPTPPQPRPVTGCGRLCRCVCSGRPHRRGVPRAVVGGRLLSLSMTFSHPCHCPQRRRAGRPRTSDFPHPLETFFRVNP